MSVTAMLRAIPAAGAAGSRAAIRGTARFLTLFVVGTLALCPPAAAQEAPRIVKGERYTPTIWVDPDGCEHWVMDDGWEGYMDARLDARGLPVCNRGEACATMPSDQLFATDSATISAEGRRKLQDFFRQGGVQGYVIAGHTDNRAGDAYNMQLSKRRAQAVAAVAKGAGARVVDIDWYGERMPKASNRSATGMQANRRVEIFCIR